MNQNKSSISTIHLKVWHSPAGLLIQGVGALKIWQRCSRILPGNTWTTREAHTRFTPPVSESNQYTVLFCFFAKENTAFGISLIWLPLCFYLLKMDITFPESQGGKKREPTHTYKHNILWVRECLCVWFLAAEHVFSVSWMKLKDER